MAADQARGPVELFHFSHLVAQGKVEAAYLPAVVDRHTGQLDKMIQQKQLDFTKMAAVTAVDIKQADPLVADHQRGTGYDPGPGSLFSRVDRYLGNFIR